jgi:putative heme-binding domain-containing protein
MLWYGIEPAVPADPDRAARLLTGCRIPLVRQYIARRIALAADRKNQALDALAAVLTKSTDDALARDILCGMADALRGRRDVTAPRGWSAAHRKLAARPDQDLRERVLVLSVLFGDPQALASLQKIAADQAANATARRRALQTLVEKRTDGVRSLLKELLDDKALRGPALRGLAAFNDPDTPALILRRYASFNDDDKADAVSTLASRPKHAHALLEAIEKGKVPRRDLSAFTARQLLAFKDRTLTEQLNKVWGSIRPPAQDRAALLARYRDLLTPAALKKADRVHGRVVFARTCASCHTLFDAGARIGPDLTGSQRTNPDYLLTKVLDPNAVVPSDYQVTRITTVGGRVISGIIKEETEKTVAIQTPTELARLAKEDIDERTKMGISLMPEGQLDQLTRREIRDLIAYLGGPTQVPLPRPQGKDHRGR